MGYIKRYSWNDVFLLPSEGTMIICIPLFMSFIMLMSPNIRAMEEEHTKKSTPESGLTSAQKRLSGQKPSLSLEEKANVHVLLVTMGNLKRITGEVGRFLKNTRDQLQLQEKNQNDQVREMQTLETAITGLVQKGIIQPVQKRSGDIQSGDISTGSTGESTPEELFPDIESTKTHVTRKSTVLPKKKEEKKSKLPLFGPKPKEIKEIHDKDTRTPRSFGSSADEVGTKPEDQ
jgi:hypothetical protein